MKVFSPTEIQTIAFHAAKGAKPKTLAEWYGVSVWAIRGVLAVIETAPSGALAAGLTDADRTNAGTAAAPGEATGQPLSTVGKGLDEVPPLREVGEAVGAVKPVNQQGQSSRPTNFTIDAEPPHAKPVPAAHPQRNVKPGSAADLAEMARHAAEAGTVKVTRCPTAVGAPTQGVTLPTEDAAAMRRRHDALRNVGAGWRSGRKAGAA